MQVERDSHGSDDSAGPGEGGDGCGRTERRRISEAWYVEVKAAAKRFARGIGREDLTATRIANEACAEHMMIDRAFESDREELAHLCLLAKRKMHEDLRWHDRVKRGGRVQHQPIEPGDDVPQRESWIDQLGDNVDVERLERALTQLEAQHPDRFEAFALVSRSGLTQEQVARCLGRSVKTIQPWLAFAVIYLRTKCEARP